MASLIFGRLFAMAGFLADAYAAAIIAALLTGIAVFAGMFACPFLWRVGDIHFSL